MTEKIYSDDLAAPGPVFVAGRLTTPVITQTLKHKLLVTPGSPVGDFTAEPKTAKTGQAIKFVASVTDPNGASGQPLEYTWNFGDGNTTKGVSSTTHAYSQEVHEKTYTVVLEVKDALGKTVKAEHPITIIKEETGSSGPTGPTGPTGPPECTAGCVCTSSCGSTGGGGSTGSTGGGTGPTTEVLAAKASMAASSVTVSPSGSFTVKVDCAGKGSCTGSVILKTASAVAAGKKKQILTLASGSFTIAAGQVKAITLHLSSKGKALLKHAHTLKARGTVVSRDSSGNTYSVPGSLTLKLAKHH